MLRFLLFTVLSVSAADSARAQTAVSTPAATTVEQLYPGQGRDPLAPATTFGDQTGAAKNQASAKTGADEVSVSSFSIYDLNLTGIMEDAGGKQALFSDAAGGKVYTLKAGRLLDSKKKLVPGVSGVIKGKQVILLTDDKKVRQIDLREKKRLLEN